MLGFHLPHYWETSLGSPPYIIGRLHCSRWEEVGDLRLRKGMRGEIMRIEEHLRGGMEAYLDISKHTKKNTKSNNSTVSG